MSTLLKYTGIILRTKDYREQDKLADIFTVEKGKLTATMRGVKKKDAKLKYASQPFCFGEYELVKSKDWYTVAGAEITDSFYDLSTEPDKFFLGYFFLEVVENGLHDGLANHGLFIELLTALKELAYSASDPMTVSIKYLLNALNALGYSQTAEKCAVCGNLSNTYYDAENGGLNCGGCKSMSAVPLSKYDHNNLRFIHSATWKNLSTLKLKNLGGLLRLMAVSVQSLFSKKFKTLENLPS
jgi:DNA repair protein RecO (recombination protein O)